MQWSQLLFTVDQDTLEIGDGVVDSPRLPVLVGKSASRRQGRDLVVKLRSRQPLAIGDHLLQVGNGVWPARLQAGKGMVDADNEGLGVLNLTSGQKLLVEGNGLVDTAGLYVRGSKTAPSGRGGEMIRPQMLLAVGQKLLESEDGIVGATVIERRSSVLMPSRKEEWMNRPPHPTHGSKANEDNNSGTNSNP
jgi:hypothetical protein